MTNMPTAGAKKVQKTCQTMHSGMTSRELVFHPQEGALAVEARPGDHYQLYPFDHFQSNGPIKSAILKPGARYFKIYNLIISLLKILFYFKRIYVVWFYIK